ncbi:uncharacterized protein LOC129913189 [Episyrphus balteatus]|uniref:uncharacterized protein LOC129913189 n=1 Tax=Episyrphus balteatus TaxID=286459 RepID=UPI002486C167|nr:uncharacterized protein LOC129913189 [Episyrphus balteatus]
MCGFELVWLLISKYFANFESVLIVYNSSSPSKIIQGYVNATQSSFQDLTQQGLIIGLHWIDVAGLTNQSNFNELMLQQVDLGIQGYISILPSVVEFLQARSYATEHSVLRLKDKFYLFLSEDDASPKDVLAQEILKLYPHHLLVSARKCPDLLELWTQKYVGIEDNFDAVYLDTYFVENRSFARNVDLYPNKLVNMLGRTMAVASVTYFPYVISYFGPENYGDVDCIDPSLPNRSIIYRGSEANIVLTFCELRNCTVKVMPFGKDNWGGIYDNGSSNGMIGYVYRKEAELGIGCYYNWYDEIFETSIAVARSAVTILGPAPSLYPPYMTNILPFGKLIWSLIILSIIVSSVVMHVIKVFSFKMEHKDSQIQPEFKHVSSYVLTLFQMVAIFFQQSFSQSKLDRFAARFFLSTLLLAGITLENTYSGQLKSLLTIPLFTDPVDTIKKFSATTWKWGAPAPAWVMTIWDSDIPYEWIMARKFEIRNYGDLKNATYNGEYGLGVERLHGGGFTFGDYIVEGALYQMILTKNDLFFDWTRAFAIRGWPFMDDFNTHILWCFEHGLYKYWEAKYTNIYLDKLTQEKLRFLDAGHTQKFPPATLSIANISGPLIALILGYIFGLLVFFLEIFISQIQKNMKK